jgi:hypothetical protein
MILRSPAAKAGGCACLALAVIGCSPITANTAYTPRTVPAARATPLPKTVCRMRVVEIVDDRMDPNVLGAVGGRTVRAPADMQAWMRSVIGGLDRSGIAVEFGDKGPAGPSGLIAKAELKTAWVSSATTAKTASVVLSLRYFRAGELIKTADYRGSISAPNWGSTHDEIQRMIDRAFDQVLSQAAGDIRAACLPAA